MSFHLNMEDCPFEPGLAQVKYAASPGDDDCAGLTHSLSLSLREDRCRLSTTGGTRMMLVHLFDNTGHSVSGVYMLPPTVNSTPFTPQWLEPNANSRTLVFTHPKYNDESFLFEV
jgi:hypothetical protein